MEQLATLLKTVTVAGAGSGLFWLLGMPAPFLTGAALFVTLGCLAGYDLGVPLWLRNLCFLTIGIGIGAQVTPAAVEAARIWPLSIAMLAVVLVGIGVTLLAFIILGGLQSLRG